MERKVKIGDKIREYRRIECDKLPKLLSGVVTKIENDLIYVDRSDGQLWVTREKFYKVSWIFVDE